MQKARRQSAGRRRQEAGSRRQEEYCVLPSASCFLLSAFSGLRDWRRMAGTPQHAVVKGRHSHG